MGKDSRSHVRAGSGAVGKGSRAKAKGSKAKAATATPKSQPKQPKVASKAGRVLGDNGSTPDERSVAGSVLATSDDRGKQQEVVATLEAANQSLVEEVERLGVVASDLSNDLESVRADLSAALSENERLKTQLADLPTPVDVDVMEAEIAKLKEQLRWRDEQASTRRP